MPVATVLDSVRALKEPQCPADPSHMIISFAIWISLPWAQSSSAQLTWCMTESDVKTKLSKIKLKSSFGSIADVKYVLTPRNFCTETNAKEFCRFSKAMIPAVL